MEAIVIIYIALTVERTRTSLYWHCEALSCRKCLGFHNGTLNRSKTDCVYYWGAGS